MPLAPMQRGMLFDHLASGTPEIDVLQVVGSLDETLDVEAFRQAWERTVRRHPVLRASLRWHQLEEALLVVEPGVRVPLEFLDESGTSADRRAGRVQQLLDAERARGLDLAQPPLARLTLIRFGPARYTLILTVHHILMDAVAFPALMRELFAIYEALCSGTSPSLPPIPEAPGDPGASAAADGPAAGEFWRRFLDGFATPTPLPCAGEVEPSGGTGPRRGEAATRLSEARTGELRRLASSMTVTLNTLVETAWGLVLSRYTGEDDVAFGVVRRVQRAADPPIGFYLNLLPLRVEVAGPATLADLLRQVRDRHVASRPHKGTPLVEIRRHSGIPGAPALFDTFVVFNRESLGTVLGAREGPWARREFRLAESLASLPLGVYAYADPCLELKVVYDTRRLGGAAATRIVEHLACVLAAMPERLHEAPTAVPMLTAAETRLLAEWNDTRRPASGPCSIHQLVQERARAIPGAVALVAGGDEVTYGELDRWADALACRLQRAGIGPEGLVGIHLSRSIEMVVAVLATLKAGAAYLPLDPQYPGARLAYMLRDARVKVVLTEDGLRGDLPEGVLHAMEVPPRDGAGALAGRPEAAVSPAQLAYVIYTSGSTGNPKGVMVEHRNVVNFFRAMDERIESAAGGVWLAVTSLSFDISALELLWTLTRGFTVVIHPGGIASLGDHLRRHRITHMQCTPSMARMMTMDDACRASMGTLRELLVGGEPLPADLAAELQTLTRARIVNMYGPTETTIWSSTFPLPAAAPGLSGDGAVVPIGRPVLNTTFHVLDRHLRRVPPGVPGELFIGGDGVARGYLNLASLTRERFIPDPGAGGDCARLYRTGDLVRHGPDGCLRFLGRIDAQIKLEGHRIEPGEIEQHLQRHPGIEQAAVVASDSAGTRHLRACLVRTPSARPGAKELRDFLGARLPDYMVPGEFLFLDRLPMTPNQKLDRKALAALDPPPATAGERRSSNAALDGLEAELAGLWQQVLGLRAIGRDDNFFDLGGDSFRAVKLHFELRTRLGHDLPLTDIFRFPTVRLLAGHLDRCAAPDGVVQSGLDRGRARRMRRIRGGDSGKDGQR